jgi:uncharacterized protein (TIGR01777 family)
MQIAVSGASGLVGGCLVNELRSAGHRVVTLVRRASSGAGEIHWDPARSELDPAAVEGIDAVVHLAGENIAGGRWSHDRKQAILESRVQGTSLLGRTLASLQRKPRVLVSASATGFYGNRGDEEVDENSPGGKGFLADVCREWEAATDTARDAGIRVVNLRIGMVLSAAGGALPRMLGPFKAGLGGVAGDGRQYISWIALEDLIGVILLAISDDRIAGPVNAVSPQPVTNREFVTTLARLIHRPSAVTLPAMAVKLMFGEMGQALLLEGHRVRPATLITRGFAFRFPDIESALANELK